MTEEIKLLGFDMSVASPEVIALLIEDAPDAQLCRDILSANTGRAEIIRLMLEHENVPSDIREEAGKMLNLPAPVPVHSHGHAHTEEERKQSLLQRVQTLSVGEKIHLAILGGRDIRSILSRDSNKEVSLGVLKNPKITESEVELLARSRNVPDEALRVISKNREWMKNYTIMTALVNNPKTPPGISLSMLPLVKTKDLVTLETNKNVPEAVRTAAKKFLQVRKKH